MMAMAEAMVVSPVAGRGSGAWRRGRVVAVLETSERLIAAPVADRRSRAWRKGCVVAALGASERFIAAIRREAPAATR